MATVPNTTTQRNPKAAYAYLDDVHGIALLAHDTTVHFQASGTGLWQTLTNADMPRLQMLGRLDLIAAQKLDDERFGSLYALIEYRNTEHARVAA